jgi:AcrR family transcriptional regulator
VEPAVNDRRAYAGTARQARTRRTRAAVVEAAGELFLERGYSATTIEAISESSDTPQATIYRVFSSKLGILRALLDVAAVGDAEPIAMGDRPQVRALLDEGDPRHQLLGFAGHARQVMSRLAPVHRILLVAAGSDPDAAELLTEHTRQRQEGQRRIARSLARARALRPGLRERDAADIIHALMSPEVYLLLVSDRAWTPERYEQWLGRTLIEQLLPAGPP